MPSGDGSPSRIKTAGRQVAKNLLLVVLSLVFALGLAEIALRIYNPLGFSMKGYKIILPAHKNEVIHHRAGSKLDETVYLHRNSLGFRGPELPPDLDRHLSIVAVGGSTTICFELADDKTWVHVLGEKLKAKFKGLWVNNAGLAGHSTFGHLILMENFIIRLRPKVVIFLVGHNEGIVRENDADKDIYKKLTWESFRSLERLAGPLADHSEVAAAILNLKRYYFPKVNWAPPQREMDLTTEPTLKMSPAAQEALKREYRAKNVKPYELRLEKLIRLCRENHILPVLITQPALCGSGVDEVTGVDISQVKVTDEINSGFYWDVFEINNEVARRVARQEGVLLIDLARELPKSSKYYYDLTHYDNSGAAEVGKIVYRHLSPYLAAKFPQFLRSAPPGTGK